MRARIRLRRAADRYRRITRQRGWIRYVIAVVALAALLPLYYRFVLKGDYERYREAGLHDATVIAADEIGRWQGAKWKLVEYQVDPKPDGYAASYSTPAPGTMVRVVIGIGPGSAQVARDLMGCQITLRDDQGREWDTDIANSSHYDTGNTSCSGDVGPGTKAKPKPYPIYALFRVPADAAKNGTIAITSATLRPEYLEFEH